MNGDFASDAVLRSVSKTLEAGVGCPVLETTLRPICWGYPNLLRDYYGAPNNEIGVSRSEHSTGSFTILSVPFFWMQPLMICSGSGSLGTTVRAQV
jgi:hypothetical protein